MLGWAELCCGLDFPRGVASVGKRPCPSRVCDCAAGGNRLAFWPEFSREAPSFTIVENTVVENAVPWLAARGPDPFPISSLPLTGLSVGERRDPEFSSGYGRMCWKDVASGLISSTRDIVME